MQEETSLYFYEKAFEEFPYQSTINDNLKKLIRHLANLNKPGKTINLNQKGDFGKEGKHLC